MEEITQSEYFALLRQGSKLGNEHVSEGGYIFDSKAEARRYQELLLMENAGQIDDLVVHPTFELQPAFRDTTGQRYRAITYEGDFSYRERGSRIVEDVKGMRTEIFKIKSKLFRYRYPHIELRIIDI